MNSLGTENSVDLFPPATWTSHPAARYAGADYPGLRPIGSWRLDPDGELRGLDPDAVGWRDRDADEPVDLADRQFVLAYGSNADPHKLLTKEGFLGGRSVFALRAAIFGWAAVWCDERRGDGVVVATLVPVPGRVEVHPILAFTADQWRFMNRWEGDPDCYRRTTHRDPLQWESGQWITEHVEVYLGTPEERPALLVDGRPMLCADVGYAEIDGMVDR
jgi:hypothetical protein